MKEEKRKSHGFFTFMKTKGRLWLLLGGALLGVVLLLFGGMGERVDEIEACDDTVAARVSELEAYETRLEKELTALCRAVHGVGECEIMITFSGGYAVKYTEDGEKNPATVGTGSNEEALFDTLSPPTVSGVGIVCRGGDSAAVQKTLIELVSTTLGIPSNRVYVASK